MERQNLETILRDQKQEFETLLSGVWCHRKEEKLVSLDSRLAQVVIGVRRSGKSILCINVIKSSGIKFAYLNFEDENLIYFKAEDLNMALECLYQIYGDFNHLFLDEIQNVNGWQRFVNRLLRSGMHIIMTGSNAKLLSSELATHMTGRYVPIELYPFSFSEYCEARGMSTSHGTTKEKGLLRGLFDEYMKDGGFPELIGESRKEAYIDELVNGILRNDIEKRYGIKYTASFEQMAQHLMNIAPVKINSLELSKEFGFKSSHTADNYVEYLERAYLLCMVSRHSYKSQIRVHNIKAYPVDISLMNKRKDAFAGGNLGWRLETVVLIELLRRYGSQGMDIAYLQERNGECDFLVCRGRNTELAVQVSYDISKESTFKREIKGLLLAAEKTGCRNLLLITDHEERTIQENGLTINIVPAYSWLVDEPESQQL